MTCDGLFESPEVQLGTIYGVRAFNVRKDNRLAPANSHGYIWTPGDNAAECTSYQSHRPAERGCGCGFYAYYSGANDYFHGEEVGMVAGVIEAWGKCQVGTRGFRAEKARIVALVVPYTVKDLDHHYWGVCKIARKLAADPDKEAFVGIGGGIATVAGLITAVVGGIMGIQWLFWPFLLLMWFGWGAFMIASHALRQHHFDSMKDRISNLPNLYPDARIFKSEDEMRAAFPLQRPQPPKNWEDPSARRRYFRRTDYGD